MERGEGKCLLERLYIITKPAVTRRISFKSKAHTVGIGRQAPSIAGPWTSRGSFVLHPTWIHAIANSVSLHESHDKPACRIAITT
jgi:hypothetical protein